MARACPRHVPRRSARMARTQGAWLALASESTEDKPGEALRPPAFPSGHPAAPTELRALPLRDELAGCPISRSAFPAWIRVAVSVSDTVNVYEPFARPL